MPTEGLHSSLQSKDPVATARQAGLRYVTDLMPGIARKRSGKGFSYKAADGSLLKDDATLARIKALVIPPAWADVWICPLSNGHLQVTGRDDRGRKQYRYHDLWTQLRNRSKFDRLVDFGYTLPLIWEITDAHLQETGVPRQRVLAAVVRLLEQTLIRVGNEEYARENQHYGLTTLRRHHVEVRGAKISFDFEGKSGVAHVVELKDPAIAAVLKGCEELPGEEVFKYVDESGVAHAVSSNDVNDYLKTITGQEYTAKDFRTWAGTLYGALELIQQGPVTNQKDAKKKVAAAIASVAERLHHTPATCRKYYVHPAVVAAYMEGTLQDAICEDGICEIDPAPVTRDGYLLDPKELAILALLEGTRKTAKRRSAATIAA